MQHPRRYFLIEARNGKVGALAPLAEMQIYNQNLSSHANVREVSFAEWLPVAWLESDYVGECPTRITEDEYWRLYG